MNGKIISLISLTALIMILNSCGGTKQTEPAQTELPIETPQPTEIVVTEAPTAKPTPRPSYTWKKHSYIETTNDGYKIEKYYSFTDKWISSSDEAQIKKICSELHIENMPSVQNIGIKINEAEPQFYYVFGKVSCANITEGWDINEDNAKNVNYHIGIQRSDNKTDAKINGSTVLRGFYSDGISQAHCSGGSLFHDSRKYPWSLGVKLNKNKSGTVPFVIAVYSQKNPNYPNGDDWYKDLEITVRDSGRYEPDFKFVPSV